MTAKTDTKAPTAVPAPWGMATGGQANAAGGYVSVHPDGPGSSGGSAPGSVTVHTHPVEPRRYLTALINSTILDLFIAHAAKVGSSVEALLERMMVHEVNRISAVFTGATGARSAPAAATQPRPEAAVPTDAPRVFFVLWVQPQTRPLADQVLGVNTFAREPMPSYQSCHSSKADADTAACKLVRERGGHVIVSQAVGAFQRDEPPVKPVPVASALRGANVIWSNLEVKP